MQLIIATRKSPLAMAQTHLVVDFLQTHLPQAEFVIQQFTTTGDQRQQWSLEKEGGKGLFTKELEVALREGRAHLAIHSAKDLPTELEEGTCLAGFLPRERTNDILVRRKGVGTPATIATSSPRRRAQIAKIYPDAQWTTIRGNVDTRLNKIVHGEADATILAAAGLRRLGIHEWEGLDFSEFALAEVVPAPGQGAIALQSTPAVRELIHQFLCPDTELAVTIERAFLHLLGGGCHSAYAAHYHDSKLCVYHESIGYFEETLQIGTLEDITSQLKTIISQRNLS